MEEFRIKAAEHNNRPTSRAAAIAIIAIWVACALVLLWWLWPARARPTVRRPEPAIRIPDRRREVYFPGAKNIEE